MKTINKYNFTFCISLLLIILLFANSCTDGAVEKQQSNVSSKSQENTIITDNLLDSSSTFPLETEKRESINVVAESTATDLVIKCAVELNGKYCEGAERAYTSVMCSENSISSIGENSMYVLTLNDTIPDDCPTVAVSPGDTLRFYLNDTERKISEITYYNMQDPRVSSKVCPNASGKYWAVVRTTEVQIPWLDADFVFPTEETLYVLAYQYIFLLVIE